MFNEMLIVYEHNTTRRIKFVSMKDYQTNNSDSQLYSMIFNQPLGLTHLLHRQLDNNHVRQFKPICKQNLIWGKVGTMNAESHR